MRSLTVEWGDYKKRTIKKVNLEFNGYSNKEESQIKYALSFWNFSKEVLNDIEKISKEQKNEFLRNFTENNNPYVALVAKMEMLPDEAFRRLLWRENIDFLSLESTLRRLSANQTIAINQAWSQLYEIQTVPSVYVKTLRGLFLVLLGFITFKKISQLSNQNQDGERYLKKGAWLYNLALLDFGFGLYRNGTKNDDKLTHKSPLDFFKDPLRKKTHENDFWVNKEDGIYYFFYYFCRSWMFFRPLSSNFTEVKWKPVVCPAFWLTLVLNSWFFFGPFVGLGLANQGKVAQWVAAFLIVPTVLWIIIVLIIAAMVGISMLYKKQTDTIKTIGKMFLFALIFYAICGIGYVIVIFVKLLATRISNLYDMISIVSFGLILITVFYWLWSKIFESRSHFRDNKWFTKIAFTLIWLMVISRIVEYRITIYQTLIKSIKDLANYAINNVFYIIIICSIVGMLVVIINYVVVIIRDEEKFWKNRWKLLGLGLLFVIIQITYLCTQNDIDVIGDIAIFWFVVLSLIFFVPLITSMLSLESERVVNNRSRVKSWWSYNKSLFISNSKKEDISVQRLLMQNNSLKTIETSDLYDFLKGIQNIREELFESHIWSGVFLRYMLHYGSIDWVSLITNALSNDLRQSLECDKARFYFIKHITEGLSFDDALRSAMIIEKEEEQKQLELSNNPPQKIEFEDTTIGQWLIKYITNPTKWVFQKIIAPPFIFLFNIVGGLWAMAMTMKDACPMTNPDESL